MPFTVVVLAYRKLGTSPAEFKDYYENTHLPLVKSLSGDTFPLTHTRHYIQRAPDNDFPAVTIIGQPSDFEYDVLAELVFEDAAKFQEFLAKVGEPEIAAKIQADEEKFLHRSMLKVASVDQVSVTTR